MQTLSHLKDRVCGEDRRPLFTQGDRLKSLSPLAVLTWTSLILAMVWVSSQFLMIHHWLAVPFILAIGALLPLLRTQGPWPVFGWTPVVMIRSCGLVGLACLICFPATFLALRVIHHQGWPLPLWSGSLDSSTWITWILYQFLYVAVAEELFFRSYLQQRVKHILTQKFPNQPIWATWVPLILSAFVFALAHWILSGTALGLLTFLPGLMLVWLYQKSGALIAPILFHALANSFYGLSATATIGS